MNKPTKILSEKTAFSTSKFIANTYTVETDGYKREHTDILRNPTVSIFALDNSGVIYLISQYRYLLEREALEAPAGFMEEGEDPLVAAKRELKEETGITANSWKKFGEVELGASVVAGVSHLFFAKDLTFGETNLDKGEKGLQLVKLPLLEAVEKVINGDINTSASVIGILMLNNLIQEEKL
jgi:ADP-ribose pyrophosphatase